MVRTVIDQVKFDDMKRRSGFEADKDVAEAAHIEPITIHRVVRRGGTFNSKTLDSIASALSCNSIDLLAVEGAPAPFTNALASPCS